MEDSREISSSSADIEKHADNLHGSARKPLKRPTFVILASGQAVSQLGDGAFRVALILYVIRVTGSAVDLGIVTAVYMIPNIATFFVSGLIVDRLPRRMVMIASDTARLLFCIALTALAATAVSSLGLIALLYALFGVADAFFQPAFKAFIPSILSRDELTAANSINATASRAGLVMGPLAGAGLVGLGGAALAFAADAASFAISVLSLLLVGVYLRNGSLSEREANQDRRTTQSVGSQVGALFHEATAGVRYLWIVRWLGLLSIGSAFINAGAAGSMDVVFPFFTRTYFGQHTGLLGVFYGLQSFGALLGAVVIGFVANRVVRPGIASQLLLVLMGTSVFLLAFTHTIAVVILLCICYGLAVEAVGVIVSTLMQLHVPNAMLGRVSAVDFLLSYSLMPMSVFVIGIYLRDLHIDGSFMVAGGIMIAAAGLPLLNTHLRGLDNRAPGAAD